ncbi:MAG TPA: calcium/sodium antiporter [Campylobacterales bacterium]|nr:calcium/sodium antiporter [Campylobacterales bacterium]
MDYIIFIVAMAVLIKGADFVIEESERVALHYNISHFVIGATLVALGTSLPEMAASMMASGAGKGDIAVSNIIGSNIINISLVLGLVFLISSKIMPSRDIFAKDSAWGLFPVMTFILISFDGIISRFEGFMFIMMMGAYLLFLINNDDDITSEIDKDIAKEKFDWKRTGLYLGAGFVMVIVGANFTIESATGIAKSFGVSEWIIGLLLIALGTSLPELMVSFSAAKKGNGDMIIGNIIGSNVANFTVALGAAALVNPITVDLSKNAFDIVAVLVISVMLVFISANKLYNKSAGLVLLIMMALVVEHSITHV